MSSVPAGKRRWNCPDCGAKVLLSITQLDPMACEACLAKLKGGGPSGKGGGAAADTVGNVLQTVNAQPVGVKLAGVGMIALLVGLLIGGPIGFVAGRVTAPPTAASRDASSSKPTANRSTDRDEAPAMHDEAPDDSPRPRPQMGEELHSQGRSESEGPLGTRSELSRVVLL